MAVGIPTQESARNTLDRVLRVAVSRRIPDALRDELGLAAAWLQMLVDCRVLAGTGATRLATDVADSNARVAFAEEDVGEAA